MSIYAPNVFTQMMTDRVKGGYLQAAKLNGTLRTVSGVVGATYDFIWGGNVTAHEIISGQALQTSNPNYQKYTAIMKDYSASAWTDKSIKEKLSFDEQEYLVKIITEAMGRRVDQVIIDSLSSITPVNSEPSLNDPQMMVIKGDGTFPSSATSYTSSDKTDFSLDAIKQGAAYMDDLGVPEDQRFLAISPVDLRKLYNDPEVTSSDYNTVKVLTGNNLDTFMGFKIIKIGRRLEGGLPSVSFSGTTAGSASFMYHYEAIGMATGSNISIETEYSVQDGFATLIAGRFSGGVTPIDKNGIIKIIHS